MPPSTRMQATLPGARVVRDLQDGFLLDHGSPLDPRDRASVACTFQRLRLEIGRCSTMRTRSPIAQALVSSCARNLRVAPHVLLVLRVLDQALHLDHHGLVHLVGDDHARPGSSACLGSSLLAPASRAARSPRERCRGEAARASPCSRAGRSSASRALERARARSSRDFAASSSIVSSRSSRAFMALPHGSRCASSSGSLCAASRSASCATSSVTPSIS